MALDAIVSFVVYNPTWGWILVVAFGLEQLFAPWETRLKKLIGRVEEKLENVEQKQVAQMTVIRAIARTNPRIDTRQVDEYLVANGIEPDDFIKEHKEDGAD